MSENTTETPKRRTHKRIPPSDFILANYWNVEELASVLGRTKRHIYRMMAEQTCPPITRLGNRVLFRKQAVQDWLVSLEQPRRRA